MQLVHEISSLPEMLYKRGDVKNSRITDKHKRQSSGGALLKDVKNFSKFTKNLFAGVSFLIKLQAGNLNLSEAATGYVL